MCLLTGSWVCAANLLVVQGQSQAAIDVLRSGLSLQQNAAKGYDTARSAYLADGNTALHQHPAGHRLCCYSSSFLEKAGTGAGAGASNRSSGFEVLSWLLYHDMLLPLFFAGCSWQ